ncbi:MAG: DUF4185 domain-containing protein [Candidatus Zhuqueibacterota bacterium]
MKQISMIGLLVLIVMQSGALHSQEFPEIRVETLPEYNDLIYNESGWTGADGSFSVALNDSLTLWLYSDTWIGGIADGKHVNATIVNNSIAIQHGKNPGTATIDYHWGADAEGRPAAFITPTDGLGYFWLFDGLMLDDSLYFFPLQITHRKGSGAFGFNHVGSWLAVVGNPADPPQEWRIAQRKIPFGSFSENGNTFLGSALLRVGNDVYIYGCHEDWTKGRSGRRMIVARAPAKKISHFDSWEFYSQQGWMKDFQRIEPLFDELASEYSVSFVAAINKFVVVYSQYGLSDKIHIRLADTPVGPWSEPRQVYVCPEGDWHRSYFCYAAKAHPELSVTGDELILTYVCNSWDFWQLASDARIYWPRFLRMRLIPH